MNMLLIAAAVAFLLAMGLWLLWFFIRESRSEQTPTTATAIVALVLGLGLGVFLYWSTGYKEGTLGLLEDRLTLAEEVDKVIDGQGSIFDDREKTWAMARLLQHRLINRPSAAGWLELSQFMQMSQAIPMAKEAAENALALEDDVDGRLWMAQLALEENQGALNQEAYGHLHVALLKEPEHDGAWLMLAMAATEAGEYDLAEDAWKSLLSRHQADDNTRALLERSLAFVQEQKELTGSMRSLTVEVEAQEGISRGGTLFVYVRREGSTGQPLAARRVLVNRFPVTVELSSGDWLSRYVDPADETLVVGARYSRSASTDVSDAQFISDVKPWPSDDALALTLKKAE